VSVRLELLRVVVRFVNEVRSKEVFISINLGHTFNRLGNSTVVLEVLSYCRKGLALIITLSSFKRVQFRLLVSIIRCFGLEVLPVSFIFLQMVFGDLVVVIVVEEDSSLLDAGEVCHYLSRRQLGAAGLVFID